ncbi:unnamed protein product [Pedinophyceae sp. YPF-701]|nr:unnamed protein product [Pedinophyceae sp. YPF-701]
MAPSGPCLRTRVSRAPCTSCPLPHAKRLRPCAARARWRCRAGPGGSRDDPFDVLGIARGSTPEEIRAAYRVLMKELHPDLNPDRDTTEMAARVNDAYEVLRSGSYDEDVPVETNAATADGDDVFGRPGPRDGPADQIFVDPFSCNIDPLEWRFLQQIARDAEADPESALTAAGVSFGPGAIQYLTAPQLAALVDELEARLARHGFIEYPVGGRTVRVRREAVEELNARLLAAGQDAWGSWSGTWMTSAQRDQWARDQHERWGRWHDSSWRSGTWAARAEREAGELGAEVPPRRRASELDAFEAEARAVWEGRGPGRGPGRAAPR